jgi:hypothetical protein
MSDTPTFERYAGIPLAIGFTVPLPRPLLVSALLILGSASPPAAPIPA